MLYLTITIKEYYMLYENKKIADKWVINDLVFDVAKRESKDGIDVPTTIDLYCKHCDDILEFIVYRAEAANTMATICSKCCNLSIGELKDKINKESNV